MESDTVSSEDSVPISIAACRLARTELIFSCTSRQPSCIDRFLDVWAYNSLIANEVSKARNTFIRCHGEELIECTAAQDERSAECVHTFYCCEILLALL